MPMRCSIVCFPNQEVEMISPLRWTSVARTLGAGIALTCACAALAVAQTTGTVKGTVTDATTQRPLDGAQISVVGTDLGTLTNAAGEYQFNVPLGQIILRIRRVGYGSSSKTVTVVAETPVSADFALPRVAIGLDAIVVTGTGVATERRKLGNTIATIDANQLTTAPVQNVSEMLAAREPGVSILPSGGLTGEGARIRIRGAASLSQPSEPIVYVDGVRVDRGGGFGDYVGTGGGGYPSRLDDINPESIEHIEILKGPAAATLYGTEASAGVIQIITKQGSRGAPQFDFMTEQGVSRFPKDRYMANWGFARSDTQATRLGQFYGTTIQAFVPFSRNVVANTLFETGYANNLSGSVSGGSSAITYYINGRYSHDDGPFGNRRLGPANDLDRSAQGSASLVILPTTNVKVKVNAEYVDRFHMTPSNNNNIYGTISSALFSKPELAQCWAGGVATGTGECTTDGNANSPLAPGDPLGQAAFGTVREDMQEQIKQDAKHFTGSVNIAYQPITQVSLDATLGVDVVNQVSTDFAPFGYNVDQFIQNDPDGYKFLDDRTQRQLTTEAKATWTTRLGASLQSTLVGGSQVIVLKLEDVGEGGEHFPGPGLEIVGAGSAPSIYERFLSTVNAGVFVQDQLAYRDWAFLTLGARYDRHSAFGKTSHGAYYPKASIALQPSSLSSWSSSALRSHFSTLRVRAAIGMSGLQPGAFDKFTTFSPVTSPLGPGLQPSNLGNPELRPEKATEWEVGSEIGILSDRAGLEVTYWNRVTRDALYARQYAPSGGFPNPQLSNIGRVDSHGWEIGLNVIPVSRPEFSIKVFGNAAFLHEIVTSLGGSPPLKVGGSYPRYRNFVKEGYAPNSLFGAKLVAPCSQRPAGATYACLQPGQNPYDLNGDGQFDTDADMLAALAGPRSLTTLLPIRVDEDGDGDFLDHYLGKSTPDWAGAFGLSATLFKNFELSSLFEYKAGNYTITDLTFAFRNSNASIGRNSDRASHVEATMLNPASTAQQRVDAAKEWLKLRALTPYDGVNQNENGRFVRWRELGISYNVPTAWASKRLGLRYVTLKAAVRNLMLWTPYTGIDPELNEYGRGAASSDLNGIDQNFGDGIDAFGLALPRRFTFSVRFGF